MVADSGQQIADRTQHSRQQTSMGRDGVQRFLLDIRAILIVKLEEALLTVLLPTLTLPASRREQTRGLKSGT
jgi:hypothetical protein